jgi:hypothetical protein
MGVKEDTVAELTAELASVQTTITRIQNTGQAWRKGGSQGFSAEQAKLSELYAQRRELKAKLATWGIYEP